MYVCVTVDCCCVQYDLLSVIIHRGTGAKSGHYHAYIKDVTRSGLWNETDAKIPEKGLKETKAKVFLSFFLSFFLASFFFALSVSHPNMFPFSGVCMYSCIYVCMCVCVYVRMCVDVRGCAWMCMKLCVYGCVSV